MVRCGVRGAFPIAADFEQPAPVLQDSAGTPPPSKNNAMLVEFVVACVGVPNRLR